MYTIVSHIHVKNISYIFSKINMLGLNIKVSSRKVSKQKYILVIYMCTYVRT